MAAGNPNDKSALKSGFPPKFSAEAFVPGKELSFPQRAQKPAREKSGGVGAIHARAKYPPLVARRSIPGSSWGRECPKNGHMGAKVGLRKNIF